MFPMGRKADSPLLGVNHELVDVDRGYPANKLPKFVGINFGKLPV